MQHKIQTQAVIDKFFKFLSDKDLEKLITLFSDNVDWNVPGNEKMAPWLGKRNSPKEVKIFYELLWENVEPVSVVVNKIFIDKEYVLISGEFSVILLQTGKKVDSIFFIEMTVINNLIVKYRLLEDSYAISEAVKVS